MAQEVLNQTPLQQNPKTPRQVVGQHPRDVRIQLCHGQQASQVFKPWPGLRRTGRNPSSSQGHDAAPENIPKAALKEMKANVK